MDQLTLDFSILIGQLESDCSNRTALVFVPLPQVTFLENLPDHRRIGLPSTDKRIRWHTFFDDEALWPGRFANLTDGNSAPDSRGNGCPPTSRK